MPVTEFKSITVGEEAGKYAIPVLTKDWKGESLMSKKQVMNCARGQGGLHHAKADVSVGFAGSVEVCKGEATAGRWISMWGSGV